MGNDAREAHAVQCLLETGSVEPQYNLALEEHLCRRAALGNEEFFMLWRNAPSIIIGRFQDAASEVNAAFVQARGLPVVRRNSGGGAVYHDLGNVNYSFIVPDQQGYDFAFFADKLIRALDSLGVRADFSRGGNDIAVEGRKVSGMAQHRHNGVLLCHGTLLFDCDLDALAQALNVPDAKLRRHGVKSVRARVGNLKPLLPRAADTEEFMALLWEMFRRQGTPFIHSKSYRLSAQDERAVRKLAELKYRSRTWNDEGRYDELETGGEF